MKRTLALALLGALALGGHALAQHAGGHGSHKPAAGDKAAASTKAYRTANDRMHRDMSIKFTGNADVDFAAGMIPHHQGAIDMAKVVLAHGKDPEIRKLAEEIIKAQEKEIAWMKSWLAKSGK